MQGCSRRTHAARRGAGTRAAAAGAGPHAPTTRAAAAAAAASADTVTAAAATASRYLALGGVAAASVQANARRRLDERRAVGHCSRVEARDEHGQRVVVRVHGLARARRGVRLA
jgi:hypothetical protein